MLRFLKGFEALLVAGLALGLLSFLRHGEHLLPESIGLRALIYGGCFAMIPVIVWPVHRLAKRYESNKKRDGTDEGDF